MTKAESDKKFDESVDFSGVEKFIDTVVKRYSSGMRVRLAFSVAGHPSTLLRTTPGAGDFAGRCSANDGGCGIIFRECLPTYASFFSHLSRYSPGVKHARSNT